ncbi:hypothetical protein Syn7502_01056 [Synechococcus sp. PCC 7502]|uniref:hypothetical protein n=1 Tax=Synechococcus sp. PCC 7502 TaxID=1173263 RepID=UPI00029FCEB7|nr:hypothetical protein [Synechococcus sp. PCC 7502]AFY73166.1 hypothetical protein Syn7502_01056 [Synechococcus sp. PCC 7502]
MSIWVRGGSRSGKSAYLVEQVCQLIESKQLNSESNHELITTSILIFAIDADNRRQLSDRLAQATTGKSFTNVTPLSFFRNEVTLFFPLLIKKLNLKSQFPILLRVENEQELAAKLWADQLNGKLKMTGTNDIRLVRRILDLYLLAAYSGTPLAQIPQLLQDGIELTDQSPALWQEMAIALESWRDFCWEKGLLTYGIITELFGRYLLPDPQYQASLKTRYKYLFMDDVDEYPAIACDLSLVMLNQGTTGIFTYNPYGSARLGLGADPGYWQSQIEEKCELVSLQNFNPFAETALPSLLNLTLTPDPFYNPQPIAGFFSLETRSRGSLLRTTAEVIITAIAASEIQPQDIAIIAPGLDNIANYALREILTKNNIPIICLSDQHPLANSALVRSLLTLMTLIYPQLGSLVSRDQVAEMLTNLQPTIDPVRAGMLSDRCFIPDISNPKLLPSCDYTEIYRLGYEASSGYEQIRQWIADQSATVSPLLLLDRAIQKFLVPQKSSYEQLANLQALLETAQYYWQIGYRLGWQERQILIGFIDLIRSGIVTANPQIPSSQQDQSVTLATIYQYRMAHTQHRWQFWLDTGSPLWSQGGSAALFGAPVFLKSWQGETINADYENMMNRQRLERLLQDISYRTEQRIYLCYSELNTAGQEQMGELLTLKEIASLA